MDPLISVVIPAHNEEKYIRQTLHSLQLQTYQNYEVVVVANGCTDKTEQVVQKKTNDKLRLLSLPKANVCVARNAGALHARGQLLVFLDADTTLDPDGLQRIKDTFTVDYAVGTTKAKADSPRFQYKFPIWFKNFYQRTKLYKGCSGALICRKDDFHAVGGYNPEIIIREHRHLIQKLEEKGHYCCVNTNATTSMRRYQQWGVLPVASFWVRKWFTEKVSGLEGSEYEKIR